MPADREARPPDAECNDMVSASVGGMHVAKTMFDVAANDIANMNTEGFRPSRVDAAEAPGQGGAVVESIRRSDTTPPEGLSGTDLAEEMTDLVVASVTFKANSSALRAQQVTTGFLLDVLA
jgi:flagellar basal body rod protein FlgG